MECRHPPRVDIPDWVGPKPKAGEGITEWYQALKDSLTEKDYMLTLDYIYDSLGIGRIPSREIEFFDSLYITEGKTDSMDLIVFKNVPAGRYQVVCKIAITPAYSELPYGESRSPLPTCLPGATDFIRVGIDSVSVVNVSTFLYSEYSLKLHLFQEAGLWHKEIMPRKKE